MISILRNLLSPKRRETRRRINAMFGDYVSPELADRVINESASRNAVRTPRNKVRVIAFFCPDWGFSDPSLPRLRTILETIDVPVEVSHNSLTVYFYGEDTEKEFDRVRMLLESISAEKDFSGFKVGVAEGYLESIIDHRRITAEAFRNEKN